MLELATAQLRFLVGQDRRVFRLRGDDQALLCASQPMCVEVGGAEAVVDPVFAQRIVVDAAPRLSLPAGHGLLAIVAKGEQAKRCIKVLSGGVHAIYLPPVLQLGLHWLQREVRMCRALPQSHLMALSAAVHGWLSALPRLRSSAKPQYAFTAQRQAALQQLRAAIIDGICEKRTLDELSSQLRLSRSSLNRMFRDATGLSIGSYRSEIRLRSAAARLLHDESGCAQVARSLGCASPSQFSTDFRRLYGVAPSRCVALIDALLDWRGGRSVFEPALNRANPSCRAGPN